MTTAGVVSTSKAAARIRAAAPARARGASLARQPSRSEKTPSVPRGNSYDGGATPSDIKYGDVLRAVEMLGAQEHNDLNSEMRKNFGGERPDARSVTAGTR